MIMVIVCVLVIAKLRAPITGFQWFSLDLADFNLLSSQLVAATFEERLQMPGMIPLRAELIVVAVLLIQLLLEEMDRPEIRISHWALKEGVFLANADWF